MYDFFDRSKRYLKNINSLVESIMERQAKYRVMSDDDLKKESLLLKEQMKNTSNRDSLLCDIFAICREASKRVLGKEHYPCQIQAGLVMLDNKIAEMATGEGKTLAAILPAYLKALEGNGVHIITSNDYLAERDYKEMGKVFEFLGLSTGLVQSDTSREERKKAYQADITYCSSSQVCFDFLRDNLVLDSNDCVLRGLNFALIDEADSILLDDAETAVRISRPLAIKTDKYFEAVNIVKNLKGIEVDDIDNYDLQYQDEYDYIIDRKNKTIEMTELLYAKLDVHYEQDDYDELGRNIYFYINNALIAEHIKKRDKDYVVKETFEGVKIEIVDANTGRISTGRQFGDGLHLAIQAKEIVRLSEQYDEKIEKAIKDGKSEKDIFLLKAYKRLLYKFGTESINNVSITFRNFLKMYDSVSGMTGTAMESREEFLGIYGLDVIKIPRNKPYIAKEIPERFFVSKHDKYIAIAEEILKAHKIGRPVLIGTNNIEESERVALYLEKLKGDTTISYEILNARPENSKRENEIIANAGRAYAITIATNMAGRGTDIKVDDEALKLGGLLVIGTERNISKRIDNQLKGRTGRQGDPGEIQFFSSIEDEFVSPFLNEQAKYCFFGEKEVSGSLITSALDDAQKRRESISFGRRKATNEIDDILQIIRSAYYKERQLLLDDELLVSNLTKMITRAAKKRISSSLVEHRPLTRLVDKKICDRFLTLDTIDGVDDDLILENINENIKNVFSQLSIDQLKEFRTIFLRNSDIELSILCLVMEQMMESPIYWDLSQEQRRIKRIKDIFDEYEVFCDDILDYLLIKILNEIPVKKQMS